MYPFVNYVDTFVKSDNKEICGKTWKVVEEE